MLGPEILGYRSKYLSVSFLLIYSYGGPDATHPRPERSRCGKNRDVQDTRNTCSFGGSDRSASGRGGGGDTLLLQHRGSGRKNRAPRAVPIPAAPFEIESADDFVLTHATSITGATFTGPAPRRGASAGNVVVEIYRVFPKNSDISRTSGPPTFSTPNVPTRVNSPSDIAFAERDYSSSGLNFVTSNLGSFATSNSVGPGGIHPQPDIFTGGDGSASGNETKFTITFAMPFALAADHYFFVPQVQLSDGDFLWLSAAKPIDASGTPFPRGSPTCKAGPAMIEGIAPDWLRVGTDITHQGPFNASFSLSGAVVPEPSTWAMMLLGFAGLGFAASRKNRSGVSIA